MIIDAATERSPSATDPRVAVTDVECSSVDMSVTFASGRVGVFNRFWLRDNCPTNGDRASLFRPFSVADLDDALRIGRATVGDHGAGIEVEFSDGTVDHFTAEFLDRHTSDVAGASAGASERRHRVGATTARFGLDDLNEPGAHHGLLEAVSMSGFAVVDQLDDVGDIERLAALLGPIRETDFGRIFEIVSEPDPFTPSQSESALDPHTDDPYRYSPAGVSILHCVSPCDGSGGASTIVDGFAIAEMIAEVDPEAFTLLSTISVPYEHRRRDAVHQGDAIHLRAEAPVIALDAAGSVCGIRFHERAMAPLRLSADVADRFYRALIRFARAVRSGEFTFTHHLRAGEAIVYDNQRVLHGRTEIAGPARRHLRLCTVDRDQVHSRLRLLRERHAPGTESAPLPAGNLS
ncbi:TauD/TfdA family dioxygenase [Ilumatobacter nonamiensis]|uniref:TauD/TfdA family dioxygenase n=1 Tax=Ilumatobacter nonamiensis TaxID=467093 RepID=UPI000346C33F|nr:TauD/TfdA family dioxygenase [Ilumatobacter nonamiensis]